jgi:predicted Zn-dependent protease
VQLEGTARIYLAIIMGSAGELAEAEDQARRAISLAEGTPVNCHALAVLAQIMLARGRCAEAMQAASDAKARLDALASIDEGESRIRLAYAEALLAVGRKAEASDAIATARDRLLARAVRITREDWRESFLHQVPENRRTLELAQLSLQG